TSRPLLTSRWTRFPAHTSAGIASATACILSPNSTPPPPIATQGAGPTGRPTSAMSPNWSGVSRVSAARYHSGSRGSAGPNRHQGRQPDWPADQRDEPELERRQPRQRRQVTQRVPRERGHHHQPEHHPLGAARPQPPREPLPHAGRRVPLDPGPPVATPEPERDQRSHHRAERAQQRARSETEKPTARDLERLAGNGPEHHLHRLGQHEPHRRGRAEARERLADRSLFQPQPAAQHQEGEEQEPSGDRDRMGREPTSSSSLRRLRPIAARSPHPAVAPSSPAPPLPSARLPTRTRARSPRIAR